MSRRLVVFTLDPIACYVEKGEIKARYYNPAGCFDEVHLVTPANRDVAPADVQTLAGDARLSIHPLGRPTVLGLPRRLAHAARLVQRLRPDVIRGHGVLLGGLQAVWAGRHNRVPVVISLHANEDTDFRALWRSHVLPRTPANFARLAWLRLFERYILSGADRVVCKYSALTSYALDHGARPRNVSVIYNCVDVERFRLEPRPANARLSVLAVNRQDPEKNPEALIRGIAKLDVDLTLVGQGQLHEHLRRVVAATGLDDRVRFVPSVPHAQIHEYYHRADVYAVCIDMIGVSIGTLEAMACGLPIVYARTPWEAKPEIVGDVALMVEPTAEGFAEGIARLATDPALRAELGMRARERVLEIRGEVMERKERNLYEQVLADPAR